MQELMESYFLSNRSIIRNGSNPHEIYFPYSLFTSARVWFLCEVLESDDNDCDSIIFVSSAERLKCLQDTCTLHTISCVIPKCISGSDKIELQELISIERAVSKSVGHSSIYKLNLKNGRSIIYDLSEIYDSNRTFVFEQFLSHPLNPEHH